MLQGLVDMQKPPEMISGNMTAGWLVAHLNLIRCGYEG